MLAGLLWRMIRRVYEWMTGGDDDDDEGWVPFR